MLLGFGSAHIQRSIKLCFHLASGLLIWRYLCPQITAARTVLQKGFIGFILTPQDEFHSFLFGDESGVRSYDAVSEHYYPAVM